MNGMMLKRQAAVIFDMDGTLANVSGIRHYLMPTSERRYKDFDAFHTESVNAPPNIDIVNMAHRYHNNGFAIVIVTARRARYRNHTAMWLALNNVPSDALYMRPNNDGRPDYHVKSDILDRISRRFKVVHAVDDNPNVLQLWAGRGIPFTRVPGWEE